MEKILKRIKELYEAWYEADLLEYLEHLMYDLEDLD